jgi:hypothetical protein
MGQALCILAHWTVEIETGSDHQFYTNTAVVPRAGNWTVPPVVLDRGYYLSPFNYKLVWPRYWEYTHMRC